VASELPAPDGAFLRLAGMYRVSRPWDLLGPDVKRACDYRRARRRFQRNGAIQASANTATASASTE
jgi:hypothetical protein